MHEAITTLKKHLFDKCALLVVILFRSVSWAKIQDFSYSLTTYYASACTSRRKAETGLNSRKINWCRNNLLKTPAVADVFKCEDFPPTSDFLFASPLLPVVCCLCWFTGMWVRMWDSVSYSLCAYIWSISEQASICLPCGERGNQNVLTKVQYRD